MKSNLIRIVLTTITIMLTITGCIRGTTNPIEHTSESMTIIDSLGRKLELTKKPNRVVCLSPAATEIVAALMTDNIIVGRTEYCNYPEEITSIATVGDMVQPSIESIVGLAPDLVISTTSMNEETLKKLDELQIPNVLIYERESFEGTYNTIQKIGVVIGEEEKARKIVVAMHKEVSDITNRLKNIEEKPRVYYMVGFGESGDFTAGGDTFIHQIIELGKGENIAKHTKGWSYSLEQIVANDPDIIIAPDYVAVETLKKTPVYQDLRAVKENKVFLINEDIISRQGPRIAEGLRVMAKALHADIDFE